MSIESKSHILYRYNVHVYIHITCIGVSIECDHTCCCAALWISQRRISHTKRGINTLG